MAERNSRSSLSARPARSSATATSGEDVRHSRSAMIRAWIILGVLIVLYLGWTLIVYFLEPGLR